MGILKSLETGKMSAQSFDGATPQPYNIKNPDGAIIKKELEENSGLKTVAFTEDSPLSLKGLSPEKYSDHLPE